jgi:putative heme-binding domain-containing protein
MRTREWAEVLDAILATDGQKLDDDQLERVIVAYRNIMVEPPIPVTAVAQWLDENPEASPAAQLAAVKTIGLAAELGKLTTENAAMAAAAERLLRNGDEQYRVAVIQAIGNAQLKSLVLQLAAALTDAQRSAAERQAIVVALSGMRSEPLPFGGGMSPPGVETVLDTLVEVVQDVKQESLRVDALNLLASVEFGRAEPLATELLAAEDARLVAGAIRVLGTDSAWAGRLAEQFLEGAIATEHRSAIEEVLRHHTQSETGSQLGAVLERVMSGDRSGTLTAAELMDSAGRGNPSQGRELFFAKKSQCGDCHQISGRGGNVGPNLTDVWKTHSLEKLVESLLQPSKEIKEGYGTWSVETDDGRIYSGLKIVDTSEATVIRNANGDDVRIVAEHIADKYETAVSLMPEATVTNLTPDEIGHLLAFLKSEEAQTSINREETDGRQESDSTK